MKRVKPKRGKGTARWIAKRNREFCAMVLALETNAAYLANIILDCRDDELKRLERRNK